MSYEGICLVNPSSLLPDFETDLVPGLATILGSPEGKVEWSRDSSKKTQQHPVQVKKWLKLIYVSPSGFINSILAFYFSRLLITVSTRMWTQ